MVTQPLALTRINVIKKNRIFFLFYSHEYNTF